MAKRKNSLNIDFSCFNEYAEKIDKLGGDLKRIIGDVMEEVAKDVEEDTIKAMESANLPAKGVYSRGETEQSIVRDAKTEWHGSLGEIAMGFDKLKPGAGGFLITGTPKMQPDRALESIYGKKSYETKARNKIREKLKKEIERLGG